MRRLTVRRLTVRFRHVTVAGILRFSASFPTIQHDDSDDVTGFDEVTGFSGTIALLNTCPTPVIIVV